MQQTDLCPKLQIVIIHYLILLGPHIKKIWSIQISTSVVKIFGYYIANKNKRHIVMNTYNPPNDVLDNASQQYARVKSGYSSQNYNDPNIRHDLMLKNLYRQQLDELMKQKQQRRKEQNERSMQEKQVYNQHLNFNKQAQRLKDLSYKNYYNLLLNNQSKITQNHPVLNKERQNQKEKLVTNGIEQERMRSQMAWQAEQRRLQQQKRSYRESLDRQIKEKSLRSAQEVQMKLKEQERIKNITYTPHEVAKMQRERKMMQISKYKQDLERSSPYVGEKSRISTTGNQIVGNNSNDFNIFSQNNHNPMVNPLPYNIQNPYILREIMKRQSLLKGRGSQNIF